LETIYTN